MTHASIEILFAVAHLKVRPPPEIFIVQRVVFVKLNQVFRQLLDVGEIRGIDKGVRRRNLFVVVVKAHDDWNDWMMHHSEEPKVNMIIPLYL